MPITTRRGRKPDKPDLARFGEIVTPPHRLYPHGMRAADRATMMPKIDDLTGAGAQALKFLEQFKFTEGRQAGKSITEDLLIPYQRELIRTLFGHVDPRTGTRYFSQAQVFLARKNAKSFTAALIALLLLSSAREPEALIMIVAGGQKQAKRTLELLHNVARTNEPFYQQLRVRMHIGEIENAATGAKVIACASNSEKLYGSSPSCVIADEIGPAWSGEKGKRLWTSVKTATGARRNPLILAISTVPVEPPSADDLFAELLTYGEKVISGEIDDPRFLPVHFITPADADPSSPETWRIANPGLGYSLSEDELAGEYRRVAASGSPSEMAAYETLRLNVIPRSSLSNAWLSHKAIEACQADVTLEDIAQCEWRTVGIDLGGADDMGSLAAVGLSDDGTVYAMQMSWLSSAAFNRYRTRAPLARFQEAGWLAVVEGDNVSPRYILDEVIDLADRLGVSEIAIDPAMSAIIVPDLEAAGIGVSYARQGAMSMAGALTYIEQLVAEGQLKLSRDELFTWAIGNVAVVENGAGRRPEKAGGSGPNHRKIDAAIGLLNGAQWLLAARQDAPAMAAAAVTLISPYTEPVDAIALLEGGTYAGTSWALGGGSPTATGGFRVA